MYFNKSLKFQENRKMGNFQRIGKSEKTRHKFGKSKYKYQSCNNTWADLTYQLPGSAHNES
jgi:N-acetylneuraminic acid mutarotase